MAFLLPAFRQPARAVLWLIIALALWRAGEARGHGIELFATAEGASVHGTLKYTDGTGIVGAPVHAYGPEGALLAEVHTDENGAFAFTATVRCDHRIVGDAGEGHLGTWTIRASELPESLPAPGNQVGSAEGGDSVTPVPMPDASADLDARIERAVARQVNPLREQLFAYEHSTRIRDVIGGIGYLFGLAGAAVFLKQRWARSGA